MAGMFGLIVAGRLVQTDFCIVSEREVAIEIADAESINHLTLFLTGVSPFPVGMAGAGEFQISRSTTSGDATSAMVCD